MTKLLVNGIIPDARTIKDKLRMELYGLNIIIDLFIIHDDEGIITVILVYQNEVFLVKFKYNSCGYNTLDELIRDLAWSCNKVINNHKIVSHKDDTIRKKRLILLT